jgi:two-component system, cell cycle response regulator
MSEKTSGAVLEAVTQNVVVVGNGLPPWQCRILILDPDPISRVSLAASISTAGYTVDTAPTLDYALRLHRFEPFDIVLTQCPLPDADVPTICRTFRGRNPESHVYVLTLMEGSIAGDVVGGLVAGADDVLSRLVDREMLMARLGAGRRIMQGFHELRVSSLENQRLALTDSLTETHNRRYLMRTLPSEIARSNRYRHPLSILSCDIDMFKRINDQFGHEAGDDVLREFVIRARGCLRQSIDWVARSGGEEFVIVAPETDIDGAVCVADRVRRAIAGRPMPTCAGALNVTVSIGATSLQTSEEYERTSVIDFLKAADRCLYVSKRLGRDRSTALPITAANSLRLDMFDPGNKTAH